MLGERSCRRRRFAFGHLVSSFQHSVAATRHRVIKEWRFTARRTNANGSITNTLTTGSSGLAHPLPGASASPATYPLLQRLAGFERGARDERASVPAAAAASADGESEASRHRIGVSSRGCRPQARQAEAAAAASRRHRRCWSSNAGLTPSLLAVEKWQSGRVSRWSDDQRPAYRSCLDCIAKHGENKWRRARRHSR